MTRSDLPRACGVVADEYLTTFRVVILNGPRQSGKTTLLRHLRGVTLGGREVVARTVPLWEKRSGKRLGNWWSLTTKQS